MLFIICYLSYEISDLTLYCLLYTSWSAERIAKYFNIKYDKIVMQILKSKINCGLIEYKGTVYEGLHEPIVSKEIFDEMCIRDSGYLGRSYFRFYSINKLLFVLVYIVIRKDQYRVGSFQYTALPSAWRIKNNSFTAAGKIRTFLL